MRRRSEQEALDVGAKIIQDRLIEASWLTESAPDSATPFNLSSGAEQGELVEYDQFIALPREILSLYRQVHNASYMGLLPELGRAWITIDNRLYLWNYEHPEQYTEYEGIDDGDVIVSVSLSSPKAGVFLDTIDYVLVVATLSEVSLFAITKGSRKLLRTACSVPCDGIIYKAVGSQCGRIFLAGSDGSLAEMVYATEPSIWKMLSFGPGSGEAGSKGRAKGDFCQLVKHGYWDSRLMRFVPAFIRPPETTLELRDALADMTVDNFRRMLYCVSGLGNLSAFYLSEKHGGFKRVGGSGKVFEVLEAAQKWLKRELGLLGAATGPGSTGKTSVGADGSSGGGGGGGGKEDVEERERFVARCFGTASSSAPLRVVGLHAVPVLESHLVHLTCTTNTGTRILLQLQVPDGTPFDVTTESRSPASVEVVRVVPPPVPSSSSQHSRSGAHAGAGGEGRIDGFVHRTFAAHGVYLASYVATRSNFSDMLCSVQSARVEGRAVGEEQGALGSEEEKGGAASHGEADNNNNNNNRGVVRRRQRQSELAGLVRAKFHSVIRDVREECAGVIGSEASLRLHVALSTSNALPAHGPSSALEPAQVFSLVGALLPPAPAEDRDGDGDVSPVLTASADALFRASELQTQCQPRPSSVCARRFLCLESQGLHILVKQRPVDRVLGVLMSCLPLPSQGALGGGEEGHSQSGGSPRGRKLRGGFGFDEDFAPDSHHQPHHQPPLALDHSSSAKAVAAVISEYGDSEFACMAVALCCGVPTDSRLSSFPSSGGLHPTQQNLNDPDLFRRELLPSFLVTTPQLRAARLVEGSHFVASAVSEGISLFVSRLLRAVWHQPLLAPDEARHGHGHGHTQGQGQGHGSPASRLNPLWSEEALSALLEPLAALQTFMEEFLPHSGSTVPRTRAQREELLARHAEYSAQHPHPTQRAAQSSHSHSHSQGRRSGRLSEQADAHEHAHAHAVYGAANVTRELEHSHLACLYGVVKRARELVHLLLVLVTWHRQQSLMLVVLQKQVQESASRAAKEGIVGSRSLELALLRDRTVRSASRKQTLLQTFQWTRLRGASFSSVVAGGHSAQRLSSVLREGLHDVCRGEERFSREEGGDVSQAEDDAALWGLCVAQAEDEAGDNTTTVHDSDSHPPDVSAQRLAALFAQHGSSYFGQAEVHGFVSFRHLSSQLSTMRNKHGTIVRPAAASASASAASAGGVGMVVQAEAEAQAVLHPKIAPHLLAAAASWSSLALVKDLQGVPSFEGAPGDSLLGLHVAMLSEVGSEDALELIVETCLTAAKNFRDDGSHRREAEADAEAQSERAAHAEAAKACYWHLVTAVCTTRDITLEQRAGMLMRALSDPELGADTALLEVVCEGLRGRFTSDLLLNLPSPYVGDYLARTDKELLFEWHLRREEYVQACALKLEQAFDDNGTAIAARIGHLRDALSVVPPEEHATVDRMLKFAIIQQDAHLRLLTMTGPALSHSSTSASASASASAAESPRGRTGRDKSGQPQEPHHYWDVSDGRSPSPHKTPRTSPGPGRASDAHEGSPGGLIRARDHLQVLEHARYRLGYTLVSEGEWCSEVFALAREINLWEANVCLLVLLDVDQVTGIGPTGSREGDALMIRLWKSLIYRFIPVHSRDGPSSPVSQFLARQRRVSEIDIDPHEQLRAGVFEDYHEWLPALRGAIQELCLKIDAAGSRPETDGSGVDMSAEGQEEGEAVTQAGPNHVSVPLAPLLAELEAIASELDVFEVQVRGASPSPSLSLLSGGLDAGAGAGGEVPGQHGTLRGWVPDALLAVSIRKVHVVRAYVHLFWSVGRGFAPEKIIKLLESLSYVLLEWLRCSAADEEGTDRNTRDMRAAVRSQEVDSWMDTLRHQLSDMSGRALSEHSKAALGRVHIEFQQLLRLVDEFALD